MTPFLMTLLAVAEPKQSAGFSLGNPPLAIEMDSLATVTGPLMKLCRSFLRQMLPLPSAWRGKENIPDPQRFY